MQRAHRQAEARFGCRRSPCGELTACYPSAAVPLLATHCQQGFLTQSNAGRWLDKLFSDFGTTLGHVDFSPYDCHQTLDAS